MPRGNPGLFRCEHPKWFDHVKVGDVIARPGGRWRVVREVNRRRNGTLDSVTLVIQRCSWTGQCYTILNFTDLRNMGYRRISGASLRLKKCGIDAKIRQAITARGGEGKKILTCCDVVGIYP